MSKKVFIMGKKLQRDFFDSYETEDRQEILGKNKTGKKKRKQSRSNQKHAWLDAASKKEDYDVEDY